MTTTYSTVEVCQQIETPALHKRAIKLFVDGLMVLRKLLVEYEKKESVFYKHLAEDVPMHYVAETEFQLQEMGGTERVEAHRGG